MAEEFTSQQSSAPFNMALATLERISDILREITKVSKDIFMPKEAKQAIKVELVRQLFINASPLLPEDVVAKYIDGFLKLAVNTKVIVEKNHGGASQVTNHTQIIYSNVLESTLDMFMINIQR